MRNAQANRTNRTTWLSEARADIAAWAEIMPRDADGATIDWDWVAGLDPEHGIGCASDADLEAGAASDVHDLLRRDYAVRDRLEPIIAQCSTAFMTDFDRVLPSYRLARAMAYANRRLNDEILCLIDRGVAEGRWSVSEERRGRATVQVLSATDGDVNGDDALADVRDRTADILDARAERRREQREQRERQRAQRRFGGSAGDARNVPDADSDWRDAYLPGRDVDRVMGIDIETTGIDPARVYVIDAGFEYMNMISPRPETPGDAYRYEEDRYEQGDAFGQARLSFGVPERAARRENRPIAELTGIDVRTRGPQSGLRAFDEWPAAQAGLLRRLTEQPYVAHNATFEHGFFMLNVAGYAEAWRDGLITIIDTLPMSRRWDPGSMPDDDHPHGDNRLDAYAKRQGALSPDQDERHLGLEDAHVMLVAMKHHLAKLRAQGRGPWGPDGRPGVGGKHCRRR
nr:DNA polymerase III subunit epsilon [Bifidobacterium sp. DSM 109958]